MDSKRTGNQGDERMDGSFGCLQTGSQNRRFFFWPGTQIAILL